MRKALAFAIIVAVLLTGCTKPREEAISKTGFYFDTVITITIYDAAKEDALQDCLVLAQTYEDYFDANDPDSDVAKINANPFTPVRVHEETIDLIQKGIEYGRLSDGKFDITVGRLSKLWDFSSDVGATDDDESFVLPDEAVVRQLAGGISYGAVLVDEDAMTVTLSSDACAIDLGGIAKGYIADRMKERLKNEGVTSGLINLGGNVLAIGDKPDGLPFAIGIQKPFAPDGEAMLKVNLRDSSIVTSGTYQRYAKVDGRLYHHILDTRTGFPYDNGLSSVTVLTDTSTDGDALSTTLFSMGLSDGLSFANEMPGVEAIFITTDDVVHYSDGIDDSICTPL